MTINTVQEGPRAIMDAVIEKKMKAKGPGCPQDATCNVNDWI